jgi:ComF family protein
MCSACRRQLIVLDAAFTRRPDDRLEAGRGAELAATGPISIVARFAFAEPVRHAIHLLKYGGERARSEWFALELQSLIDPLIRDDILLVPVPLTKRRERLRGFNQSAEITRHLSKLTGAPHDVPLRRIRETRPQVELSGLERIHNVRGAFQAASSLDRRTVILIDDVVTTGATLRECATACLAAGASAVVGLAAASGLADGRGEGPAR